MPTSSLKIALIIPTLNAERDHWENILQAINNQSYQPDFKLILDSTSTDSTTTIGKEAGFEIHHVKSGTFDHAGTRKWGIDLVKDRADIVIFMTQDALLADSDSFKNLINSYSDDLIAAVYGRQLPREHATSIEKFGRLFNYPERSDTRSLIDRKHLGMKVAFCSDSYASYRIKTIVETNAFPEKSIVGEDYITVARLLLNGFKIRYESLATVKHSHDYTIKQEFSRYFDIGVFHQEYSYLLKELGATEKAGAGYVKSEIAYLIKNKPFHIPLSLIRTTCKFLGYKLGKNYENLSDKTKKRISMHSFYF